MILYKKYAYARDILITRECPVCHFKCETNSEYSTRFIPLEAVYNYNQGERVKLYACPNCGTVGVDIYEIEYKD